MRAKEPYQKKLEAMWREYEARLPGEELVQSRLRWEDWIGLRKGAVDCARQEIRRRKWRGGRGGVLPGCGDAEDIADQAIMELLEGKSRLSTGWSSERLAGELERLVSRRVRVLHGRRETGALRSEWAPPREEGAEPKSVLTTLPDEGINESRARAELEETKEEIRSQIERSLKGEPDLRALFGCLWAGVTRPAEIARRLGIEEREVVRARKRLDRRLQKLPLRCRLDMTLPIP